MAIGEIAAQQAPEMLGDLQPLVDLVQPLVVKASILVGGIFGLYLILIIVRVYYERKKIKILHDIRYDLDQMNISQGVTSSRQKKGIFRKMMDFFITKPKEKRMAKELKKRAEKPAEGPKKKKKRPKK